jgi:hypothetical protein
MALSAVNFFANAVGSTLFSENVRNMSVKDMSDVEEIAGEAICVLT